MRLHRVTGPIVEPATTAEAKAHLSLAGSSQDELVNALIAAARGHIEAITNRALLKQQWIVSLNEFPVGFEDRDIHLPLGRCLSVTQIQYRDALGVWQAMSGPDESPPGTLFEVDLYGQTSGIVRPAGTSLWPDTFTAGNAVRIHGWFGYGTNSTDLPPDLKQAVLVRVADMYDGRSEMEGASDVSALMARPYKIGGFRA